MFCKSCGKNREAKYVYCPMCGDYADIQIDFSNIRIQEEKQRYCKECGSVIKDRYCTNCGIEGHSVKLSVVTQMIETNNNEKQLINSISDQPKKDFEKEVVKYLRANCDTASIMQYLFSGLWMLIVGLVVSLIMFMLVANIDGVKEVMDDLKTMEKELGEATWEEKAIRLRPSFIDLYGIMYQLPYELKVKGENEDYNLSLDGGVQLSIRFLILLIIPILIVYMSQRTLFKDGEPTKYNMSDYFFRSIAFTLIIQLFFGLFNNRELSLLGGSIKIGAGFNSLLSFCHVFISTFITMILLSIIAKKEYRQSEEEANSSFIGSIPSFLRNMCGLVGFYVFVIIGLVVLSDYDIEAKIKGLMMMIFFIPNIFLGTWLILFGGQINSGITPDLFTFTVEKAPVASTFFNGLHYFGEDRRISLWTAIGSVGRLKENCDLTSLEVIPVYLVIILLAVGLLALIIKQIKRLDKEKYYLKLTKLAVGVSLLNGMMGYFVSSSLKLEGEGSFMSEFGFDLDKYTFQFGFDIKNLMLSSFLIIFSVGLFHYYMRGRQWYIKLLYRWEKYDKLAKWGYVITFITLVLLSKVCIGDIFSKFY